MHICYRHHTKLLQIELHHRIREHLRILPRIPLRYVYNIRLQHHRISFPIPTDKPIY
ncbi:abscisic acid receptor pyl2 [Phtheirospermum japonicum]|uniref:Abscisic acid receptor pyl2 n=1 Tax=Phtheirospermum japonicum TaxID=374723 RepID=A0A830CI26_9LAMI|nr:abscisic acid receptor pyl2 [Phtheirospermum japonicum]